MARIGGKKTRRGNADKDQTVELFFGNVGEWVEPPKTPLAKELRLRVTQAHLHGSADGFLVL